MGTRSPTPSRLVSDDILQVEEGSLYPALQRMLLKGWVTAEWGVTAGNRRARYYRPTAEGANSSRRRWRNTSASTAPFRKYCRQPEVSHGMGE